MNKDINNYYCHVQNENAFFRTLYFNRSDNTADDGCLRGLDVGIYGETVVNAWVPFGGALVIAPAVGKPHVEALEPALAKATDVV